MEESSRNRCKVVFLTTNHSINGELYLEEQRLSDYLNDPRESTVELHNASISRLSEPSHPVGSHPLTIMPKARIALAFELSQATASRARRFYGYIKKHSFPVFLATEGMEVQGLLHTTGSFDFRLLSASPSERFLPITDAIVTLWANRRYVIQQSVVLVNLHHIHYISQIKTETAEKTPDSPKK